MQIKIKLKNRVPFIKSLLTIKKDKIFHYHTMKNHLQLSLNDDQQQAINHIHDWLDKRTMFENQTKMFKNQNFLDSLSIVAISIFIFLSGTALGYFWCYKALEYLIK